MHEKALEECEEIWAAVAYLDNAQLRTNRFIDSCHQANVPLKLYARYDYSIPVGMEVLKWFLNKKSPNYSCHLVPNLLHSKIIWYRSYGIYVGSANLTCRAWDRNLEAGFFLTEMELEREKMLDGIKDYFAYIDTNSHDLTQEIYDNLLEYDKEHSKELKKLQDKFKDNFKDISKLPQLDYLDAPKSRKNSHKRKKEAFLKEWNSALQYVRDIGTRIAIDYKPVWIDKKASKNVIADQFLHAYYENEKIGHQAKVHKIKYEENKANPEKALINAMKWWKNLSRSIYNVDIHIHEWSPKLQDYFSKERLLKLSEDEFVDAMTMIHSFSNYARQADCLGKGNTQLERTKMLAKVVYNESNSAEQNILELLDYVLYKGSPNDIPDRMFEACHDKNKRFPYVGISTVGEVVGMAMPDKYPTRNGRTSKGLVALGYNVKIHTE